MTKIDWTRPVETVGDEEHPSQPVTIFTTEAKGPFPVVGQVENSDMPSCWTLEGKVVPVGGWRRLTLRNVRRRHEGWVNAYPETAWETRERADANAKPGRIDCIRVEWEE
jgi:hypothetical protein